MTRPVELDIEIAASGEVTVEVKGAPGTRCLEYVDVFSRLLGDVKEQQPTPEFYEAELHAQVQQGQSNRRL